MTQPPPIPPEDRRRVPPVPAPVSYRAGGTPMASSTGGLEDYNRIAETVGMVPTLRVKDNVVQAVVVVIGAIIGAVVGFAARSWWTDAPAAALPIVGAVAGLVLFGLISGMVLMVLGWIRAGRARRR